jgi:hypothetical protein
MSRQFLTDSIDRMFCVMLTGVGADMLLTFGHIQTGLNFNTFYQYCWSGDSVSSLCDCGVLL